METDGQRSSVIAMKLALEALEKVITAFGPGLTLQQKAATALRQELETEQQPVAWANESDLPNFDMKVRTCPDLHHTVPLYTAPQKREWVGLTDEEIIGLHYEIKVRLMGTYKIEDIYRAIEKRLKEKNT